MTEPTMAFAFAFAFALRGAKKHGEEKKTTTTTTKRLHTTLQRIRDFVLKHNNNNYKRNYIKTYNDDGFCIRLQQQQQQQQRICLSSFETMHRLV